MKGKSNGPRNRAAGHGYERSVVKLFHGIGYPNVITSRSGNRFRDGQKVDLVHNDEVKHGRFPYNVQCKCTAKNLAYSTLLAQLPDEPGVINVIFNKQTKKSKIAGKFMHTDSFAILYEADFMKLIGELEAYKKQAQAELIKAVKI